MFPISESASKTYVSADGDDMGSRVAAMILAGDVVKARKLSMLINLGGKAIVDFAKKTWGAQSVILGGDDMMVEVPSSEVKTEQVEAMRKLYAARTKSTLSCGIGSTPEEAMKAIVIAKNTGKNKAIFWERSLEGKYKQVVKVKLNELRTKLRAQTGITEGAKNEFSPLVKKSRRVILRELRRMLGVRGRVRSKGSYSGPDHEVVPGGLLHTLTRKPSKPRRKVSVKKAVKASGGDKDAKKKALYRIKLQDTLRQHLINYKAHISNHNMHAHLLALRGEHGDADAHRRLARLKYKKMIDGYAALTKALTHKDVDTMPASLRKHVDLVASLQASKAKHAEAHARKIDREAKRAREDKLDAARDRAISKLGDRDARKKSYDAWKKDRDEKKDHRLFMAKYLRDQRLGKTSGHAAEPIKAVAPKHVSSPAPLHPHTPKPEPTPKPGKAKISISGKKKKGK